MEGVLLWLTLFIALLAALIAGSVWFAWRRDLKRQQQRAALDARGIRDTRDDEQDPLRGPP